MRVPLGFLFLLLLSNFGLSLIAQTDCRSIFEKAVAVYNNGNGKLDEALQLLFAVEACDSNTLLQKDRLSLYKQIFETLEKQTKQALVAANTALQERQEALRKLEIALENEHIAIGNSYYFQGKYNEAILSFNKALAISMALYGTEHLDIAKNYRNLGITYKPLGDYKKSEFFLQKSLEIQKKILGEKHPDYASSLYDLASLYSTINSHQQAIIYYEKTLTILRSTLGVHNVKVQALLYDLIISYKKLGNIENAKNLIDILLKIENAEFFQEFKIPPPEPSARELLSRDFFKNSRNLLDVNKYLNKALDSCGYFDRSYYALSNGFALVARIEQIDDKAKSIPPPDRWIINVKKKMKFTLGDYFEALFFGKPGYYRVIVFVVNDTPFKNSYIRPSRDEVIHWLDVGTNMLPIEIGKLPFTDKHFCTALIYEFELPPSGEKPKLLVPSNHTGRDHIIKSRLWQFLDTAEK